MLNGDLSIALYGAVIHEQCWPKWDLQFWLSNLPCKKGISGVFTFPVKARKQILLLGIAVFLLKPDFVSCYLKSWSNW